VVVFEEGDMPIIAWRGDGAAMVVGTFRLGPADALSYAFDHVMREIVSKLIANKLKVPINIVDLIIDQSSTKEYLDHPVSRLKAELGHRKAPDPIRIQGLFLF
jgi:hypothetical protein